MKKLLPEHAERVAEYWAVDDWFVDTCPAHLKVSYTKDLIARGLAMGVFEENSLLQPVGWTFRKMGEHIIDPYTVCCIALNGGIVRPAITHSCYPLARIQGSQHSLNGIFEVALACSSCEFSYS